MRLNSVLICVAALVASLAASCGGSDTLVAGGGPSFQQSAPYRDAGDAPAYRAAAQNQPKEGSVTQTSEATAGVTTDTIEVIPSFTDAANPEQGVTLDVSREKEGSSPVILRTDQTGPGTYLSVAGSDEGAEEYSYQHYLQTESSDRQYRMFVSSSYYRPSAGAAFAGDWLAGGIWLEAPRPASGVPDPASIEVGVFADGGLPYTSGTLMAATGTATYTSEKAYGLYFNGDETDFFSARISLTADFDTDPGTVSGGIDTFLDSGGTAIDGVVLTLQSAEIDESMDGGFFSGDTAASIDTEDYTGSWGGQFYGPDTDDKPAHVAGTFGAATGTSIDDKFLIGVFAADQSPATP